MVGKPADLEVGQGQSGEQLFSLLVIATGSGRKSKSPEFRFPGNKIDGKLVFLTDQELQFGKTLTNQLGKGVQSPMVGPRISFRGREDGQGSEVREQTERPPHPSEVRTTSLKIRIIWSIWTAGAARSGNVRVLKFLAQRSNNLVWIDIMQLEADFFYIAKVIMIYFRQPVE